MVAVDSVNGMLELVVALTAEEDIVVSLVAQCEESTWLADGDVEARDALANFFFPASPYIVSFWQKLSENAKCIRPFENQEPDITAIINEHRTITATQLITTIIFTPFVSDKSV